MKQNRRELRELEEKEKEFFFVTALSFRNVCHKTEKIFRGYHVESILHQYCSLILAMEQSDWLILVIGPLK